VSADLIGQVGESQSGVFHWKVREADVPVIFLESVIKERRQEVFSDRVRHFLKIPANTFDDSLHELPPLLQRLLNGRIGRLWKFLGNIGEFLHGPHPLIHFRLNPFVSFFETANEAAKVSIARLDFESG